MELVLTRTYHKCGTNGVLWHNGSILCFTIELPWANNWPMMSCIPEGRYRLTKRYTTRLGFHLMVKNVPDREYILIHPANDALKELRGCIAPVLVLTAPGKGEHSRDAFYKVLAVVYKALKKEKVWLTIGAAAVKAVPVLAPVVALAPGGRKAA